MFSIGAASACVASHSPATRRKLSRDGRVVERDDGGGKTYGKRAHGDST